MGPTLLLPRRMFTSLSTCTVLICSQAPSWQWFYPYHFAPFAADFTDVDKMQLNFVLGQPFKPFEQLMSVFPAAR